MSRFRFTPALIFIFILCSCSTHGLTSEESKLINDSDSLMRVLTIEDSLDLKVLRSASTCLSAEALLSEEFGRLSELMVTTVTHPSQEGVGIAAPQVGLNRRVVAVQRFDKEPVTINGRQDHPFEVYANINIVWASDSLAAGPEGCLSVPDMRGEVMRSQKIVVEYADLEKLDSETGHQVKKKTPKTVPTRRDTVRGFTAVIFQHEIDHLEGILYTDRL